MNESCELELGTRCNCHCVYCEQGNVPLNSRLPLLGLDEVKAALASARSKGARSILLQGGEPTIHPDIVEIVRYANKLRFGSIKVFTNGRMFAYEDFTRSMVDAGLTDVVFTLVGQNAKMHDGITRSPGSYAETVAGIKNCLACMPAERVVLSCVLISDNFRYIGCIVDNHLAIGQKNFHFIFIIPYDSILSNQLRIIPRYSDVLPYVADTIKRSKSDGFNVRFENFPFCLLKKNVGFAAEFHRPKLSLAKVQMSGFHDKFQVNPVVSEKCLGCSHYGKCMGLHANYQKVYGSDEIMPADKRKVY